MIQVKCIQKFRDKYNRIYGYQLQDLSGKIQDVTPIDLKRAIENKQVIVTNLDLTLDGRLIDRKTAIQPKSNKTGKTSEKPYEADSYTEFIKRLIPLIEKAFKFSGQEKFVEGSKSIDNTTGDITWLCGCMGDFIYDGYNCYIEIDYSYDVDSKDGVLTYDVMIKGGDDSHQYTFKYEFDSLNMKAHFNQILKETQRFIYHVMNNWKHI